MLSRAPGHIPVLHRPVPLQRSTPKRPPTSPHCFFLSMHQACGSLGERGVSARPEFSAAPRGGPGFGGAVRHRALGPAPAGRGPAFGAGNVLRGAECCSRSPRCILISAAAAAPRGRPSIFHTKKGSPARSPSKPSARPTPPNCGAGQRGREGGGGRQTHRQGPKDPGNSSQDLQGWDQQAESGTAPWR